MIRYIFVLGHNPALSALEILKTAQQRFGEYRLLCSTSQAAIIEGSENNDIDNYLCRLGGTIKIGIQDGAILNLQKNELNTSEIKDYIIKELEKGSGQEKLKYGFSIYAGGQEKLWQKNFYKLGLDIKRYFKKQGKKARFIVSKEPSLSSVIVKKEKLESSGRDFIFFIYNNKLFLGKTMAVQDFSDYSERDYGRPGRDLFSGMLPVKLAKILINISGTLTGEPILDPFCGSGTILTEALSMGYKKVNGTDSSQQAIINSKNNIDWLQKKFKIAKEDRYVFLEKMAVEELPKVFSKNSIQAIITEPYLGSPYKSRADINFRSDEMKKIENLYFQAFSNFFQILKADGTVVIIWPAYSLAGIKRNSHQEINELFFLSENLLGKILNLGFIQERFDNILSSFDKSGRFLTKRGSILYFRPGQRVWREIFIFKKQREN